MTRLLLLFVLMPISWSTAYASWCIQLSELYFVEQPFAMTKELEVIGPVRKQCGGTCWASAGTSFQEHRILQAHGFKEQMSAEYIISNIIRERFLTSILEGQDTKANQIAPSRLERRQERSLTAEEISRLNFLTEIVPSARGGSHSLYTKMLHKYGSIPDKFFVKSANGNWSSMNERLAEASRNFRNVYLKEPQGTKAELSAKFEKWIDRFLMDNIGRAPKTFKVNGVDYSPTKFFQDFDPAAKRKIVSYYLKEFAQEFGESSDFYTTRESKAEDMIETIKKSIDSGYSVYTGMRWTRKLAVEEGILNVNVNRPQLGDAPPHGKHAVIITGYALNENGSIKALKIQNSWGDQKGRNGFYVVAPKEFYESVRYVQVLEQG